ncbi:selenocysteine-specific translation elongation factor [Alkalicoccus halolimnae]|uniref:Selenocysteine-specific elongation factor n=1 Tax=Alkalicoccus halolimnae TaxID=1667239 RepID=A0A5C7FCS7_9BACI|nr:selenocysteine-specific translation elongation factor [Alkalicoccus halolimnae]TXF87288.1 selenocysteine-specific translation elongation factor [Alkalicoccus halolimnae]
MKRYYTIGMAGHIDHGKTTLTKALTNMDTDRLKEEKERAISIEPGYAPLVMGEDMEVSVVDVPGHEKFIRQMIAGVAGIDAVLLIIAADEGVMPQTKEHLRILQLLGVKQGMIVFTKAEGLEEEMEELLKEDIESYAKDTFLENSPVYFVDSISNRGIENLKEDIHMMLEKTEERKPGSSFRMPIDQSFTVKGQGTVVRGTVFNGKVEEGDVLRLLPQQKEARVRQLQVHHEKRTSSRAGQRTALNLGGIEHTEIHRGDVLVKGSYPVTKTIDVALTPVDLYKLELKQRSPIKIHIGTSEIYGTIVFFDRNSLLPGETDTVLCQIRLDEKVVAERNDRFILRRPTPVETIGGGTVIDPYGEKYRFGSETIQALAKKKEGTPEERIIFLLENDLSLTTKELAEKTSLSGEEVKQFGAESEKIRELNGWWVKEEEVVLRLDDLLNKLYAYHEEFPLRPGKDIAELLKEIPHREEPARLLIDHYVERRKIMKRESYVSLPDYTPAYPKAWARRMEQVEQRITKAGIEVPDFFETCREAGLKETEIMELRSFLLRTTMTALDEKHLINKSEVEKAAVRMRAASGEAFTLQEAKQELNLSRKYLVPLLELFDRMQLTKRSENKRIWK